jgi:tRNA-splicing ligase RtcB (3'-phosphate/5'-hydroxy nucleic acid ligase)
MVAKRDFVQREAYLWEIPADFRPGMRVPIWLFADDDLLEDALGDLSMEQALNVAALPGLVGHVVVMPDVHQGYGMPIGGVMASALPHGVISPGAVGYDINCGVRLLASSIEMESVRAALPGLATALYHDCPSGVGTKGQVPLSEKELERVCREGARWAASRGMAEAEDLACTEEGGCLEGAHPDSVSVRAKERGRPQLGTLGAGNHFIEIDVVEEVFDEQAASTMGLRQGCLTLQIHCGSRGFGHQVCTDYVQDLQSAVRRYRIELPDRELVCAPLESPEGHAYLGAMRAAANYAFANRQVLAHLARGTFARLLGGPGRDARLRQVYDLAHNMAKLETHHVEGQAVEVCVHRKGATRAFGPGAVEIPEVYRAIGQPVLVPGSMGTASWVLAGTRHSTALTFGSACHGAGRVMSRAQAKREIRGQRLRGELESRGIHVRAGSLSGLAEEAPQAYKDVDRVVDVISRAGVATKVARLQPLAVVKG